jgi:HEAT repeat protein
MPTIQPILLGLALLTGGAPPGGVADLAQAREMLHDRQNPGGQSQAALLLVQSREADAEAAVRQGLRQAEDAEVFLALAAAVRVGQDGRFAEELFAALAGGRPRVRQGAAEALAALADAAVVERLRRLTGDCKLDPAVRQAALWTLGRCGRKSAARALLDNLEGEDEGLRRAAADALADLSGQNYGLDSARWNAWWDERKGWGEEQWLERRLAYQASRARRLEGDLARARAQVLRLEQQLYGRLPLGERLGHIQSLLEQDDPAVRLLAITWSAELLPGADAGRLKVLVPVLLRLSQDDAPEVQRAAVLALGKVQDPDVFERLFVLLEQGRPAVRSAAARSLAAQARGTDAEARARQKRVMPALQKALADPAHEVVVETAEELGALGALEAGPVLTGLLHHPAENVRQAAAQALERVADASVLDALLAALDDPSAAVRFGLVGALARAASDGHGLPQERHQKLLARLEGVLLRDADAGVRSRAATVLGEFAPPALLKPLWDCVVAGEDGRVQEKAWAAFLEVLARSGNLALLREWDRTLTASRQGPRRLQMLGEMAGCWQRQPDRKEVAGPAQEMLIEAYLELGKWGSAAPVVRELLTRPGSEAETDRRLRWLLAVGEQALHEGNRAEAQRAVQAARPYLPQTGSVAEGFDKLEKAAQKE